MDGTTVTTLAAAVRGERIVADLRELIAVPSVNPLDEDPGPGRREAEAAAWYGARLGALGLTVVEQTVAPGRPNLVGRLPGAGPAPAPTLALVGHLDTVDAAGWPDAFHPRVAHGRVYGRGACDMKGALCAFLEVIRVLRESRLPLAGDLAVVATADEEWRLLGSRGLAAGGLEADFGIVGEPTELRVCPSHRGEYAVSIRTFGKAVHSSVAERGHNAIDDMAAVLGAFSDLDAELGSRPAHPLCGHGRFSVGTIRGGTLVATVPDSCEIEVDRRTVPGETGAQVREEYRRRLETLSTARPGLRYEIAAPTIDLEPLETALDSPVVTALTGAVRTVTGSPARVAAFPAGTDAPNLPFPSVICGPGSLEQAHASDEYVEIEALAAAARVYLLATLDLLGCTEEKEK